MPKKNEGELLRTTVRLPQSLMMAAKHRAIDEGHTLQELIIRAVEHYLSRKGGK